METHENLHASSHEDAGSTDRGFGLVFTAVSTLYAFLPLRSGGAVRIWALVVAAVFLTLALLRPAALHDANRLWTRFGGLLSKIVNPIVIGALYLLVITPVGWAARKAGHDPLKLEFDPSATTYWIDRNPAGPAPESLSHQF